MKNSIKFMLIFSSLTAASALVALQPADVLSQARAFTKEYTKVQKTSEVDLINKFTNENRARAKEHFDKLFSLNPNQLDQQQAELKENLIQFFIQNFSFTNPRNIVEGFIKEGKDFNEKNFEKQTNLTAPELLPKEAQIRKERLEEASDYFSKFDRATQQTLLNDFQLATANMKRSIDIINQKIGGQSKPAASATQTISNLPPLSEFPTSEQLTEASYALTDLRNFYAGIGHGDALDFYNRIERLNPQVMNNDKKTRILQYINFDYNLQKAIGAPQQQDYASYSPEDKKLLLKFESIDNAFNHNRYNQEKAIPTLLTGKDLSTLDSYINGNNDLIKRAKESKAKIKNSKITLPDNISKDGYFDAVINYYTENNKKLEQKKAQLTSLPASWQAPKGVVTRAQIPTTPGSKADLEIAVQEYSKNAKELATKAKNASNLDVNTLQQLIQEGNAQVKNGVDLYKKARDSAKAELKNTVMTASSSLSNSVNSLKTSLKIVQLPKFD